MLVTLRGQRLNKEHDACSRAVLFDPRFLFASFMVLPSTADGQTILWPFDEEVVFPSPGKYLQQRGSGAWMSRRQMKWCRARLARLLNTSPLDCKWRLTKEQKQKKGYQEGHQEAKNNSLPHRLRRQRLRTFESISISGQLPTYPSPNPTTVY